MLSKNLPLSCLVITDGGNLERDKVRDVDLRAALHFGQHVCPAPWALVSLQVYISNIDRTIEAITLLRVSSCPEESLTHVGRPTGAL
jgi:hypothetical protein